jgi:hypothetical protein
MRFMLMVKATKDSEAGAMPSAELVAAMDRFNKEMLDAGVLLAGEGLHPSANGARVTFYGDGRKTVVRGPFAETPQLVAGFWLIQAKSLEEAIEWASRAPNPMPDAEAAQIEVRRVFDLADFPAELQAAAANEPAMRAQLEKRG